MHERARAGWMCMKLASPEKKLKFYSDVKILLKNHSNYPWNERWVCVTLTPLYQRNVFHMATFITRMRRMNLVWRKANTLESKTHRVMQTKHTYIQHTIHTDEALCGSLHLPQSFAPAPFLHLNEQINNFQRKDKKRQNSSTHIYINGV